jgi:preprotein translocase subunit SecG
MVTLMMVIHIILVAALIGIILLQKSEGGALGLGGSGGGGMGGFMTARGSANLLTRATAVLATLFFISTLGLALMVKGTHKGKSILIEDDSQTATAEPIAGTQPSQPKAEEPKSKVND